MVNEEILQKLKGATCKLDDGQVAELVQEALDVGIPALEIIAQAIVPIYWTCPRSTLMSLSLQSRNTAGPSPTQQEEDPHFYSDAFIVSCAIHSSI